MATAAAAGSPALATTEAGEGSSPKVPKWLRTPTHGAPPPARGGHVHVAVGNLVIVFGGTRYDGDGKFVYMNDLWALDTDTMKWHKPKCAGRAPGPRYAAAACVVEYKVYVFGGKGDGMMYNDLWCLDVERWAWEHVPSSTAAPPNSRFGHAMVAIGDKLGVFGGWDSKAWYNDFWLFDIATFTWVKPSTSGIAPSPRHGHIMVSCSLVDSSKRSSLLDGTFTNDVQLHDEASQRILIFGGWWNGPDGVPVYQNDTRALDLHTLSWSRPRLAGEFPSPRYWHAATAVGNVVVSIGGWNGPRDDARAAPSEGVEEGGSVISIPYVPGMGSAMGAPGKAITVPYGTHRDTFFLDLDAAEWIQPHIAGKPLGYRYGAGACTIGAQVFIFGGWESGRAMNDLVVLDMSSLVADDGGDEEYAEGDYQEQ